MSGKQAKVEELGRTVRKKSKDGFLWVEICPKSLGGKQGPMGH